MIRVLIVEDDHLVRKGLISAMPWKDFQMEVVGEAANGQKALEFLEKNEVDLIMTDLNMPVMTGSELMRKVHLQYPHIFIVVLTLHQDFEYIQEALRLGAIDFIAKIELEKEKFAVVLERIYQRVLNEKKVSGNQTDENFQYIDTVHVLISEKSLKNIKKRLHFFGNEVEYEYLNDKLAIFRITSKKDEMKQRMVNEVSLEKNCYMLEVTDVTNYNYADVRYEVKAYFDKFLFYETDVASDDLIVKSIFEIEKENKITVHEFSELKNSLLSFHWVFEDLEFERLVAEMERLKLSKEELALLLRELEREWNRQFSFLPNIFLHHDKFIKNWHEWRTCLFNIRKDMKIVKHKSYSAEMIHSIFQAVRFIKSNYGDPITAELLANQVNLSRSYFNRSFKDLIGVTFHQYIKEVRMEKAKELLSTSREPIQWIAEHCGYMDDKYFSKTFKEYTQISPSEYRKKRVENH